MSPAEGSSDNPTRTILVIDDDVDILDAVQDLLFDEGYEVVLAMDGKDGLRRLQGPTPVPDLVLVDLCMPGMNGWEFMREIRNSDRTAFVPVVVFTALEPRFGYPVPNDRVIRKPVKVEWMCRVLRELIGPGRQPPPRARPG